MRLSKPPEAEQNNSFQRVACNRFNINDLETTSSNDFHQGFECGSGPGGRRFKSLSPRPKPTTWSCTRCLARCFRVVRRSPATQESICASEVTKPILSVRPPLACSVLSPSLLTCFHHFVQVRRWLNLAGILECDCLSGEALEEEDQRLILFG
jgi:hypothetical protein